MANVRRVHLVRRGVEQLEEADRLLGYSTADKVEQAAVRAEIAGAYARLAEALGEGSFNETPNRNW